MSANRFKGRCVCCDAEKVQLSALEMFVLGIGLGEGASMDRVLLSLCPLHLATCLVLMKSIQDKVNALHAQEQEERRT